MNGGVAHIEDRSKQRIKDQQEPDREQEQRRQEGRDRDDGMEL